MSLYVENSTRGVKGMRELVMKGLATANCIDGEYRCRTVDVGGTEIALAVIFLDRSFISVT